MSPGSHLGGARSLCARSSKWEAKIAATSAVNGSASARTLDPAQRELQGNGHGQCSPSASLSWLLAETSLAGSSRSAPDALTLEIRQQSASRETTLLNPTTIKVTSTSRRSSDARASQLRIEPERTSDVA